MAQKPATERILDVLPGAADVVRSETWDPGEVMHDLRLPDGECRLIRQVMEENGLRLVECTKQHPWSRADHEMTKVEGLEQPLYLVNLDFRVIDKPTPVNVDAMTRIPQLVEPGSSIRFFTGTVAPHLSFVRMANSWEGFLLDARFVTGRNLIDFDEGPHDVDALWTVLEFAQPPPRALPPVEPELRPPPERRGRKIFVSYSHRNKPVFDRLLVHLLGLVHSGEDIDVWSDERIRPGEDWHGEISDALTQADFLVLLVSADFLASEFVRDEELPLLDRADETGLKVFWLKAEHGFVPDKIARFQALHQDPPLGTLDHDEMEEALEAAIGVLVGLLDAPD